MGQRTVLEWLESKRVGGCEEWFCVGEVKEGLRMMKCSDGEIKKVGDNLYRLAMFGLIEWRGVGWWQHRKEFRAKNG